MSPRQPKTGALLTLFGITFALLLGGWLLVKTAHAATPYEVVCPADGNGPEDTLKAAITAVNNMPQFDTLVISVTGTDCLFTLVDAATDAGYGPAGLPRINRNLIIRAVGGRAIIERSAAAPRFRLMESYANLTLDNITLRNGEAAPTQSDSTMPGSAIYAHQALTLTNVLLTENAGERGGAVYVMGTLVMDHVTVSGNHPQSHFQSEGGGIFAVSNLFATNITVTKNVADLKGGAIYVGGNAVISAAIFHNNRAAHYNGNGGGLYVVGNLTLSASDFISNSAGFDGGGIYVEGSSTISDVHFARNIAGNAGGGIAAAQNPIAKIEASSFISNSAAIGGGASIQRGVVQETLFENNSAKGVGPYFGGGALFVASQATIQNNRFINNSAPIGGAFQLMFYPPDSSGGSQIINNLWIDNDASSSNGGAIAIGVDVDVIVGKYVEVKHNTIVRQTRSTSSAVYIARSMTDVANNIITQHRIGVYATNTTVVADANLFYANVLNYVGTESGTKDLTADPLFVDGASHDYHLQSGSPAQDSGLDLGVATDLDGVSRPQGEGYERGAFEIEFVNHAPLAQSESYTTAVDTTLVITAPGVLGNDSDPDGDVITATMATIPAHGEVTLQSAGAFSYTPTVGFTGTDSFTYQAYDGFDLSAAVAVTIHVVSEPISQPVTISGLSVTHDGPAARGQTVNFVANVEAGSDIHFAWDFGDGAAMEGATASHAYTDPGDYDVVLTASNSVGDEQVTTTVVVLPDASVQHQIFTPFIVK